MSRKKVNHSKGDGKGQKAKVIPITDAIRKRKENQTLENDGPSLEEALDVLLDFIAEKFSAIDRDLKDAASLFKKILKRLDVIEPYVFLSCVSTAALQGRPLSLENQKKLAKELNGNLG